MIAINIPSKWFTIIQLKYFLIIFLVVLDFRDISSKSKFIILSLAPESAMLPINQRFTCSNSLTVKVLERHSTSPKDLWNQWREKNSHIPTASTLPCYFGCGYSSYNTALLTKSGIALPEKPGKSTNKGLSEIFVDKAKQWGVTNEPFARKIYEDIIAKKMLMNIRPYSVQNGDESTIIEISSGEDKVTTLVTPDMVVEYYKSCLTDEHRKRVVEFKCPFFCVLKNKHIKPILDICLDYVNTHPYGVPSAYIQACTYAIANDADKITLVYYFTDSVDSESLLEYNYARDREFDCLLLNLLILIF